METTAMLIALPIFAFITAWAIARWRAQQENQQLHSDLDVARAELARLQGTQAEQQSALQTLAREKATLDMACVRLETERNAAQKQLESLERLNGEQKAEIGQLRQSEHLAQAALKGRPSRCRSLRGATSGSAQ
jgi:DNA recombination protein RmuC